MSQRLQRAEMLVQGDVGGLDDQRTSSGHGVARVDAEIHYNLLDVRRISAHDGQIPSEGRIDFNVAADHLLPQAESLDDGSGSDPRCGVPVSACARRPVTGV